MKSIYLYNTLSKSKEELVPSSKDGKVGMYVCGPTVYDRPHLGNSRSVVIFDVLYRLLQHKYGAENVKYVRNITDVDDKIIKAASEKDIAIDDLTRITTEQFQEDSDYLNCLRPNVEPRATEHIRQMIGMIEQLINNGNAYAAEGHVLFDVSSDSGYGHLSRRSLDEMIAGARVEVAPYKKNAADFVLWKPAPNGESGWDSPWGYGRPGWHIECSAMSSEYLGVTFDIHGGGADLMFPHHENEIAQSKCANKGSEFAKTWVHNGFLTVNGEKMSKSLGNFITVDDLRKKGIKGEVIRYALLTTHYRKPMDWNDKLLSDAEKSINYFYDAIKDAANFSRDSSNEFEDISEHLNDDLNISNHIVFMREIAKEINKNTANKQHLIQKLLGAGRLIGIFSKEKLSLYEGIEEQSDSVGIDEDLVRTLINQRTQAKLEKNWAEADRIRNQLTEMGVSIIDQKDGTTTWSVS